MSHADLNTLSQFVVVAKHLNFRRAAAQLAIAPSTLSERIRGLEDDLGVRLLNRTTRSCALTDEGKRLFDRVAPAIGVIEEASTPGVAERALAGTLRINGPRPAIELRLMPRLRGFLAEHPGVRVELVSQGELVDVVAEGFDAGLR